MVAGVRSAFLFFVSLCCLIICSPIQAQVNGVPASVTSLGFGGKTNPAPGVRASVTSLGPNGYGYGSGYANWPAFGACCDNFFLPANPNRSGLSGHHHHRKDTDKNRGDLGIIEPVYIPYAVPYAAEADNDADDPDSADGNSADADAAYPGPVTPTPPRRTGSRNYPARTSSFVEQPVTAQASTVLVFKDGHKSDVLNYAIVGDSLIDFSSGRNHKIPLSDLDLAATTKANDDRGVDFQIPTAALGQ